VILPVIGSGMFLFYVLFSKLSEIKSSKNTLITAVMDAEKHIDDMEKQLDHLKDARSKDLLDFTHSLNQFNITLSEFKVTLRHMDGTMQEIKGVVETLKKNTR
jgi:hypothetical protein